MFIRRKYKGITLLSLLFSFLYCVALILWQVSFLEEWTLSSLFGSDFLLTLITMPLWFVVTCVITVLYQMCFVYFRTQRSETVRVYVVTFLLIPVIVTLSGILVFFSFVFLGWLFLKLGY